MAVSKSTATKKPATKSKLAATKKTTTRTRSAAAKTVVKAAEYTIAEIGLDKLNVGDSPTQIVGRFDAQACENYAQVMKDGLWNFDREDSMPTIFKDSEGAFWIGDGHHTIEASFDAGIEQIKCKVYSGTQLDAKAYSLAKANRNHGVRLDNAAKAQIVIQVLSDHLLMQNIAIDVCGGDGSIMPSSRAIVQWLGNLVSSMFIDKHIDQLTTRNPSLEWLFFESRIGVDGVVQTEKKKAPPKPIVEQPKAIVSTIDSIDSVEPIASAEGSDEQVLNPIDMDADLVNPESMEQPTVEQPSVEPIGSSETIDVPQVAPFVPDVDPDPLENTDPNIPNTLYAQFNTADYIADNVKVIVESLNLALGLNLNYRSLESLVHDWLEEQRDF